MVPTLYHLRNKDSQKFLNLKGRKYHNNTFPTKSTNINIFLLWLSTWNQKLT